MIPLPSGRPAQTIVQGSDRFNLRHFVLSRSLSPVGLILAITIMVAPLNGLLSIDPLGELAREPYAFVNLAFAPLILLVCATLDRPVIERHLLYFAVLLGGAILVSLLWNYSDISSAALRGRS